MVGQFKAQIFNIAFSHRRHFFRRNIFQHINRQKIFFTSETKTTPTKTESEPTIIAKDKAAQEREAWDLLKNSADAEDFRFYLKEFPSGANIEKARIRLEELVWLAVRNSTDRAKVQTYLNEFPNGANASAARIKLRQIETAATTPTNPNVQPDNRNADDALAELEAWNKIKNSTNQTDFQNFL